MTMGWNGRMDKRSGAGGGGARVRGTKRGQLRVNHGIIMGTSWVHHGIIMGVTPLQHANTTLLSRVIRAQAAAGGADMKCIAP